MDALTDTIKVAGVSASYTPNTATDQFLSILPGGSIIAAGVALTSVTGAAGVLSAADTTFASVSGAAITQLVIYKDTGSAGTSPLLCLIDTSTGLPITPNGGNIVVSWSSGQVFAL